MDITENKGWNSDQTASQYQEYAEAFPMYKETSHTLVEFAEIRPEMIAVDLACGTGMTSKEILARLSGQGKVYAVDLSQAMLVEARKQIQADNVTFINAPAGGFDKQIPEQVDRVVCNSAFWQFKMELALQAIHHILKDDGRLVFNLPDQFYNFGNNEQTTPSSPTLGRLMRQIAREEYGFTPPPTSPDAKPKIELNFESVKQMLEGNGFVIEDHQITEGERPVSDSYEFNKIPVMTEPIFPGLNYETRMQILEKAYQRVDKNMKLKDKWIYFRVKKADNLG